MDKKYIICSVDNNYKEQFFVMLTSLLRNNLHMNFHIYIMYEDLESAFTNTIDFFLNKYLNFSYQFIKLDDELLDKAVVFGHVSKATYYRLLIPKVIPNYVNKILYLDLDIVIKKNISRLWEIKMTDSSHLGVENSGIDKSHKEKIGISVSSTYFNAGVLMINLKWWRMNDVYNKAFDFIIKNPDKIVLWDQDVLNVVLENCWKEISFDYNAQESIFRKDLPYYRNNKYLTAYFNPIIIHYTGGGHSKPWHKECRHELKNEYAYYHYKSRVLKIPVWIRIFKLDIQLNKYTLPLVFINRMKLKSEWVFLLLFKSIKHKIRLKFLKK